MAVVEEEGLVAEVDLVDSKASSSPHPLTADFTQKKLISGPAVRPMLGGRDSASAQVRQHAFEPSPTTPTLHSHLPFLPQPAQPSPYNSATTAPMVTPREEARQSLRTAGRAHFAMSFQSAGVIGGDRRSTQPLPVPREVATPVPLPIPREASRFQPAPIPREPAPIPREPAPIPREPSGTEGGRKRRWDS